MKYPAFKNSFEQHSLSLPRRVVYGENDIFSMKLKNVKRNLDIYHYGEVGVIVFDESPQATLTEKRTVTYVRCTLWR